MDIIMMWAAATLCFFCSGEITVPTEKSFDHTKHLAWGDIAIDSTEDPQSLKVHLRRSKVDQTRKGCRCIHWKDRLPFMPSMHYMAVGGPKGGPFFQFQDERPLTKALFTSKVRIPSILLKIADLFSTLVATLSCTCIV